MFKHSPMPRLLAAGIGQATFLPRNLLSKFVETITNIMISYDDFAKLDIRIGTILSAEIVEGADKLLKLTVDVNESDEEGNKKTRQIVSGIREYFPEPEVLAGKQCPFLVNLEPRVIRGLESQGMILAAGGEETFALLFPSAELNPGTKIR